MGNISVTVRMDRALKDAADELFDELGLSLSAAVNMFVRQSVRDRELPFTPRLRPNEETLAAMREAESLLADPYTKGLPVEEALAELKR